MASKEDYWNQTYVEGMSGKTEKALDYAFGRLANRDIPHSTDCGVICRHVHNYLSVKGVKSQILSGQFIGGLQHDPEKVSAPVSRDHVWLNVGGKIVDPTAIQYRRHVEDYKPEQYSRD
jgi:hypothetical protein